MESTVECQSIQSINNLDQHSTNTLVDSLFSRDYPSFVTTSIGPLKLGLSIHSKLIHVAIFLYFMHSFISCLRYFGHQRSVGRRNSVKDQIKEASERGWLLNSELLAQHYKTRQDKMIYLTRLCFIILRQLNTVQLRNKRKECYLR